MSMDTIFTPRLVEVPRLVEIESGVSSCFSDGEQQKVIKMDFTLPNMKKRGRRRKATSTATDAPLSPFGKETVGKGDLISSKKAQEERDRVQKEAQEKADQEKAKAKAKAEEEAAKKAQEVSTLCSHVLVLLLILYLQ